MHRLYVPLLTVCLLTFSAAAQKKSAPEAKVTDSGSFSINVGGKHMATETFRIEQTGTGIAIHSELTYSDEKTKAKQKSDMDLDSLGGFKKYVWQETVPNHSIITVESQDENFLTLKWVENGEDLTKAKDQLRPLGRNTSIIDDNFFVHMEVLAWKYLSSVCKADATGKNTCSKVEGKYPVLIPHQQLSMVMAIKLGDEEKYTWKGVEHHCMALKLSTDAGDVTLLLAEDMKMIRVYNQDGLEVVRD